MCWHHCLDTCYACCWFCLWRAIERALEAAGTGGASSSAGESHVQCLRQEDQPQLPLMSNLRRHWTEGSISSVTVQELAHSAASQGAHGMDGAPSAGQGGRQPKNLHRYLMALFGTPRGAPAFTWLRIPMRNGPDLRTTSLAARVLLRTLRAPPFAVGREHQRTTRSSS